MTYYRIDYYNCPALRINEFIYYTKSNDLFLIRPNLKLDCLAELYGSITNFTSYDISNLQYQVEGYALPTDFLYIVGVESYVREDIMTNLKPGFSMDITVTGTINGKVVSATTTLVLLKANIIIQIVSSYSGG